MTIYFHNYYLYGIPGNRCPPVTCLCETADLTILYHTQVTTIKWNHPWGIRGGCYWNENQRLFPLSDGSCLSTYLNGRK